MYLVRFIATGGLALSLCGCVATETARFSARSHQQAMMRDGRPAIVSKRKGSLVIASPAGREMAAGRRPVFVLAINNSSRAPVDFRLENVSVTQTRQTASVAELPVVTYEQLVSEERARQVAAAVVTVLAAGANAYAASGAGYGTTSGRVVTSNGRSASFSTTTYSPAANAIAQARAGAQNEAMIADTIETGQRNLAALEGSVIKDNTIMPGEWYGGQLHFSAPEANPDGTMKTYTIRIRLGEELHEVDVTQGRSS